MGKALIQADRQIDVTKLTFAGDIVNMPDKPTVTPNDITNITRRENFGRNSGDHPIGDEQASNSCR
jgi:hypothetical protein